MAVAKRGPGRRRAGRARDSDPRVPIDGERVRAALRVFGLTEKRAALELSRRRLAKLTQPALNNICQGLTASTRRSVRDGLAALLGPPVTSAWLGAEEEVLRYPRGFFPAPAPQVTFTGRSEGQKIVLKPDGGALISGFLPTASDLEMVRLAADLARAWAEHQSGHLEAGGDTLAGFLAFRITSVLLDLDYWRGAVGGPEATTATGDEADEVALALANVIRIVLNPWISGKMSLRFSSLGPIYDGLRAMYDAAVEGNSPPQSRREPRDAP